MVEFLHVRRWEKIIRTDFYWVKLLMYTIWKYWIILLKRLLAKNLCEYLAFWQRKLYMKTWYSSKTFLSHFLRHFASKYIWENIWNNLAHKDLI